MGSVKDWVQLGRRKIKHWSIQKPKRSHNRTTTSERCNHLLRERSAAGWEQEAKTEIKTEVDPSLQESVGPRTVNSLTGNWVIRKTVRVKPPVSDRRSSLNTGLVVWRQTRVRPSHLLFVPQLGLQLLNSNSQLGVFLLLLIGFFTLSLQLHDLHREPRNKKERKQRGLRWFSIAK